MSNLRQRIPILCVLLMLPGCTSLTVKSPPCNAPPLPPRSELRCQIPEQIKQPTITEGELFLRYTEALEMYRDCLATAQNLENLRQYREKVCSDLANQNQSTKWYEFWK